MTGHARLATASGPAVAGRTAENADFGILVAAQHIPLVILQVYGYRPEPFQTKVNFSVVEWLPERDKLAAVPAASAAWAPPGASAAGGERSPSAPAQSASTSIAAPITSASLRGHLIAARSRPGGPQTQLTASANQAQGHGLLGRPRPRRPPGPEPGSRDPGRPAGAPSGRR